MAVKPLSAEAHRRKTKMEVFMKCWICGKEATKTRKQYDIIKYYGQDGWVTEETKPSKYHRCYCESCMERIEEQEAKENREYIRLKKRRMFLTACDKLEKQHTDMYEYQEAIGVVEEFAAKNPDKFDSSYEMLSAIVLIHNRIHAKMQQKVGRYQVDFVLPELMCILEIDGDRHKHKKSYDSKRDREIKETLGGAWEIVRIDTEYLDQNAKALPKAIDAVLMRRRK